jgi:YfiH family protein
MLLHSDLLDSAGFSHAFPTRGSDDAALLQAVGGGPIVQVKQVHGARAVLASEATGAEGDALISRAGGGAAVGVRVADCVPVLVASTVTGDVAAIHAGWRGVVAGVVGEGVQLLTPGDDRSDLVAAIGPCIGPCCFEVGREVGAQIGHVVREVGDKVFVDLRAAVRAQLASLGVHRVEDVPGCTKHEPERFHSFRRDGANSGRMLAAIAPRARRG